LQNELVWGLNNKTNPSRNHDWIQNQIVRTGVIFFTVRSSL